MRANEGYLLPDDVDPELDVCIRAYVPDDPRYIAAFWGSYEYLANWMAWERDTAKRGKDAAARWRTPFERARNEWDCAPGECGIVDVRQSSDPCILEKKIDCDTWEPFADLSLCKYNITIPIYGDGESILQIDDTLWELKVIIEQIDAWLDDSKSADEIKLLLAPFVSYGPGVGVIVDNMAAMTSGDRDTAIAALDWDDIREGVYCGGQECWPNYVLNYAAWLNCAAEWIFDTLDATANGIFDGLTDSADWLYSTLSLDPIARAAGGGGSGFGGVTPQCRWVIEWFEIGLSEFVVQSAGTIDSGGLVTAYHSGSGVYRADFCSSDIPAGRVTDKVTIEAMAHDAGTYHDLLVAMRCDYSGGLVEWQDLTPDVWETRVFESTPLETSSIHVYLRESISSGGRIRRVKVEGYYS